LAKVRVLVVDDEAPIRRLLRASLDGDLYDLAEASGGEEGIRAAAVAAPDIILLDLGLPDLDGLEVTRRIREWSEVPIIVLSARGDEMNKVAALDAGANDYVTKPFSGPELFARMRAALRAARPERQSPVVVAHDLEVDLSSRLVRKGGKEIHLTKTEFRLLSVLARQAGRVLTHRQLLLEVWGPEYEHELHYLRVYAQQLRTKIEDDPSQPKILLTETGVGYRLKQEDAS
jgi:two-component system KDP operon response regulator KdpE